MQISERDRNKLRALFPKFSYGRVKHLGAQQIYAILSYCHDQLQKLDSDGIRAKLEKTYCQLHSFKDKYGVAYISNANNFNIFNPHDKANFGKTQMLGSIACRCGCHFDSNPFARIKKDYAGLFSTNWLKGYLQQWRTEITLVATFDKSREEIRLNSNPKIAKGNVPYRFIVYDQHKYFRIHPDSFGAYDWDSECWFEYWGPEEDTFGVIQGLD